MATHSHAAMRTDSTMTEDVSLTSHLQIRPGGEVQYNPYYSPQSSSAASPLLPVDAGRVGNARLRFTVLYLALCLVAALLPLWLPLAVPSIGRWVRLAAVGVAVIVEAVIVWCAVRNYNAVGTTTVPDWDTAERLRRRHFKHVVAVAATVGTTLDDLVATLDSLASQDAAKLKLVVVVSLSSAAATLSKTLQLIDREYRDAFADLILVVHPAAGPEGWQHGSGSRNLALREAYAYCTIHHSSGLRLGKYTITTADPPTRLHPAYFAALEADYNRINPSDLAPPRATVWQPAVFFNGPLQSCSVLPRVFFMRAVVAGLALPTLGLHAHRVQSYPLELGIEANFVNPRYAADDILSVIRFLCASGETVSMRFLAVPVQCDPRTGAGVHIAGRGSVLEDISAWSAAVRHYAVGAAEALHYGLIHGHGARKGPLVRWLLLFTSLTISSLVWPLVFVAALLPVAGDGSSRGLSASFFSFPVPTSSIASVGDGWIAVAGFAIMQIFATVVFVIDAHAPATHLAVSEDVSAARSLLHWLAAPLVSIATAIMSLVSLFDLALRGK